MEYSYKDLERLHIPQMVTHKDNEEKLTTAFTMSVDGLEPVSVLCEIVDEDGSMARLPKFQEFAKKENIKIVSIDDLFSFGDFGLARWLEHQLDHQIKTPKKYQDFRLADTMRIGGTTGYLPPESFQRHGSAISKYDVFSFNFFVLEIVLGRRAIDLTF
ncbi:hypothetical protein AgCh_028889 [Apium graveolens]